MGRGVRYTMGRGGRYELPLYGKLNPHGILNPPIYNKKICREVKISCVGGRYSMGKGVKIP